MANVDLVDLLPILKAILRVKEEYKLALDTTENDFGLFPVLTENFLDESYNNGYEVGFKQCLTDFLGTYDGVEISKPRQMRTVEPTNFSVSGNQDYDTLTDIMAYCLGIRQTLKGILDIDSDLFELYPPQLLELASSQWAAGLNDGYIAGLSYIEGLTVLPPTINYANNYFWLTSTQSAIPTLEIFYKVGSLDGDWIPYIPGTNLPIDDDTRVYAYCAVGTKNSEVASRLCTYDDFLTPTISFSNNSIYINSNYYDESGVKTKYKLSTWENYNEFVDYDGDPIPITETATVWAYNYLGDQVSTTVEGTYTPTITPATRPATPEIFFSSQTNIVTITCGTPGAKIYWKKAGTNTWVEYNGAFKIVEDGTYTAMAILDGVESLESSPVTCTVSISGGGVTPSTPAEVVAPTILCNNNKIYVYTSQSGVSLKIYKVSSDMYGNPGHVDTANNMNVMQWYDYSTPVSISESGTYMAMAVLTSDSTKWAQSTELHCEYVSVTPGSGSNPGGGSGSSTDEYVAQPLMTCNDSILSITPITAGSTVYYREKGTTTWITYTSPITINADWTYEAYATKNGYNSSIAELYCETQVPIAPTISCTADGLVTMSTVSSGASIVYKKQGDTTWSTYSGPFYIYETETYQAKSVRNGYESSVTETECVVSLYPVTMTFTNNTLTITCDTTGADIYYKTTASDSSWTLYSGPVTGIYETTTYQARAAYLGNFGATQTLVCNCPNPVMYNLNGNTLTLTCSTDGASIYWKNQDDTNWTLYTPGQTVQITEYGYYQWRALKDTNYSYTGGANLGTYIATPVITFDDSANRVTMTCATSNATIYYRTSPTGSWNIYTGYIDISQDTTFEAKAILGNWTSKTTSLTCEYTSIDYSSQYFTIEAVGQIQLAALQKEDLYYSTDLVTWSAFPKYSVTSGTVNNNKNNTLTFNNGTKIYFRQTIPVAYWDNSSRTWGDYGAVRFLTKAVADNGSWGTSGSIKVYGNILSLVYGSSFASYTTMPNCKWLFYYMFENGYVNPNFCCKVSDAENLILPTNTTEGCYTGMFQSPYQMGEITKAPVIPASTLAVESCAGMFRGCYNLTWVKCLATTHSASDCTYEWLKNVSSTGTFIKKTGVSWSSGASGIPSGWTVQESNS